MITLSEPTRYRQHGRPSRYAEAMVLKAVVVLLRLPSIQALLEMLDELEWAGVRARWCDRQGAARPDGSGSGGSNGFPRICLPGLRAWGGCWWPICRCGRTMGRAVALDSTPLQARGTPWHQSQRRKGICPDTRVDPDAHWCASGWHGWTFAIKRQNILTACPLLCVWLPLAAQATPGNVANSTHAPHLLDDLAPLEGSGGLILAESVYQDPEVRACCTRDGRTLVASRKGLHL